MRVRFPQPPQGWAALRWEVGVVFVGIFLALGAQQFVDDLRWKEAVRQEKVDLDQDVRTAWDATSARRVVQPCVTRRLADIARVLDRHARGEPLGINGPIGRATVWSHAQSALAMASGDGTLAHIPLRERSAYFRVKAQADEFQRAAWEERGAWRVLNRLNQAVNLDDRGWNDIVAAYQDALDSDRVMRTNLVPDYADGWLSGFNDFPPMPINRDELENPLTRDLCKAAVMP